MMMLQTSKRIVLSHKKRKKSFVQSKLKCREMPNVLREIVINIKSSLTFLENLGRIEYIYSHRSNLFPYAKYAH